jgi:hypothetical protein
MNARDPLMSSVQQACAAAIAKCDAMRARTHVSIIVDAERRPDGTCTITRWLHTDAGLFVRRVHTYSLARNQLRLDGIFAALRAGAH